MMVVDEDEGTTPIKDKILGWFKLLQRKKPPLAMTKKTFTIAVNFNKVGCTHLYTLSSLSKPLARETGITFATTKIPR